ncbi:MAG TPA: MarR family transcriptional regulator [Pseudonocardiaceae bacterium]|nr:MarR family transcriptional regulator [Pseudonocardiaceae bacterium]
MTASAEDVAALTRALLRKATSLAGAYAAGSGLNPTDRRALQLLDELSGEPVTVGALATRLGLSPAATTALVDRLVGANLVERVRDLPDRRRIRIQLTPAARRLGAAHLAPVGARIRTAVAALSQQDAQVVAGYLRGVIGDD